MAKKAVKKKTSKKVAKKTEDTSDTDALFAGGEPATGFSNLPEGTYEGYIKPESAIIEPKDGGRHKASLVLVCTDDEYENRTQTARYDLSTQIGVNIFLGDLDKLGFSQPTSVKEAAELLPETDNVPVRFWVGPQRDEYPPKVRINERLEEENGTSEDVSLDDDAYTKKDVMALTDDETEALADELEIDHTQYEEWSEVRKVICEELGL